MNNTLKVSLIVFSVLLLIGIVFYFCMYNKVGGLQDTATDKDYKIFNEKTNDTIFAKASSWGLTGDHIQIQLSTFPIIIRAYDSTKNYIFYEPTIYYQQRNDTLIIYSPSLSDLPSQIDSSIKIMQVQIDGPKEIKKYNANYKSLGLNKISVLN